MTNTNANRIHHGRNIKRFREMLGLKQEAFAAELGEDWTQRRVSLLEAKEEVEEKILEQVAQVLKVPVEGIKNFTEESALNIISNTFQEFKDESSVLKNYQCEIVINPIEKWLETMEENKRLYERLLESEQHKVTLLESILKQKS